MVEVLEHRSAAVRLLARLALSAGLTAAALALTRLTAPAMGQAYFFAAYPAVAAAALLAGTWCGVLTALATVLGFVTVFLPPVGSPWVAGSAAQARVAGLAVAVTLVSVLAGGFRRAYGRAQAARERAEAAEGEARRLAETQERLMAVLGHDLRTPLSAIRLASEMLRRSDPTPAQARSLERIASSSGRMAAMIGDLLDVARARQGLAMTLSRGVVRLDEVCLAAVEELRHATPGRDVRLAAEAASVDGDASRLHQVVANLLTNAVRHGSPHDPVTVEVAVDRGAGSGAVLRVSNRGDPIPPEALRDIFNPFARPAPTGGERTRDGLGLGLFIVHQIVQAHGGAITVSSTARDGTTFTVELPTATARVATAG